MIWTSVESDRGRFWHLIPQQLHDSNLDTTNRERSHQAARPRPDEAIATMERIKASDIAMLSSRF